MCEQEWSCAALHVHEHKRNIFNTSSEPVSLAQSLFYFLVPHLQWPGLWGGGMAMH
jgi:hypothetical protein